MNLFGRKRIIPFATLRHSDFKPGLIIQMAPGYHTKNPYYVEVIMVEENYIVTHIPDRHQLKIYKDSPEWSYHIRRMTIIGDKANFKHLLYNQTIE